MTRMTALVYEAPRQMVLRELDIPEPGPGEVVVEVAYSGICGSEISGFLGESSIRTPPLVFGHEISGTIAAVGPDADGIVGARVAVNPLVSCGTCRYCVTGRQHLCPARLLLGASLPGANAGYVRVPSASVLAVPDLMDLSTAAMIEPVAFAIRAVERSGAGPSDSALVIGAGAIGLLTLQVLAEYGVRDLYAVERNPVRRARAEAAGATVVDSDGDVAAAVRAARSGWGVDLAFDAVGSAATRRSALASVVAGGTVVLAGLHTDGTELPINTVVRSEITLMGVFAYSLQNFRDALRWLAADRVGLREGVVVAGLDQGQAWYERLVDGDPAAKVLLAPAMTGGLTARM